MKTSYLLRFGLITMLAAGAFLPQSVAQRHISARGTGTGALTHSTTTNGIIALVKTDKETVLSSKTIKSTLHPSHAKVIEEIGSYLPSSCQESIRNLYIRYDNPKLRGLGGKSTVIVSGNLPLDEFRTVLAHEILGHALDLGCLTGKPSSGVTSFRDGSDLIFGDDPSVFFYRLSWSDAKTRLPESRDGDFVSGYARTDAFEDVAESIVFYLFHREEFRRVAAGNPILAAKFQWIETYAFPGGQNYALSTYTWNESAIPWDATVLPYVWLGPARLGSK